MYIKCEIEATIDAMLKQGKVVLVTGARQMGKTTALKHHLGGGFDYVSMDDPRERALALEDASGDAAQTYANVVAVREADKDSAKTVALVKALQSETVKNFIAETYNGAVVAIF